MRPRKVVSENGALPAASPTPVLDMVVGHFGLDKETLLKRLVVLGAIGKAKDVPVDNSSEEWNSRADAAINQALDGPLAALKQAVTREIKGLA